MASVLVHARQSSASSRRLQQDFASDEVQSSIRSSPLETAPEPRIAWQNHDETVRSVSNLIIIVGTITSLGLAIMAFNNNLEYSASTVIIVLLLPAFFGGGCLLTLVNVSWVSRRPGKRCSILQAVCNLVLALMSTYVTLWFWPYSRSVGLGILFGGFVPMFIFVNLPSVFVIPDNSEPEEGTVMIDEEGDDPLFEIESVLSEQPTRQQTTDTTTGPDVEDQQTNHLED